MSDEAKPKLLLNKSKSLDPSFREYLTSIGIEVVDSLAQNQKADFVLVTDSLESAEELDTLHETVNEEIPVIALTEWKNREEFVKFNGKAQINPEWLKLPFGKKVISNYFIPEQQSVNLSDTFGALIENYQSINVVNHIRSGYYADLLMAEAFEKGFNLIAIRTFFSNLVYYLFYLRQSQIASVPIQVEYGAGEGFYAMRISATVSNFVLDYIWDCFKHKTPINPLDYILGDCVDLANYFDICFLEKAEKIIFTGVWANEEQVEIFEYPSFAVSNIFSVAQYEKRVRDLIEESQIEVEEIDPERTGSIEKMRLPGKSIDPAIQADVIVNPDGSVEIQGVEESDGKNRPDEESEQLNTVKGGGPEREESFHVKGSGDEEDKTITKVSGSGTQKDGIQIVKGGSDSDDKSPFNIKSLLPTNENSKAKYNFVESKVSEAIEQTLNEESLQRLTRSPEDEQLKKDLAKNLTKEMSKKFGVKDKETMQKILSQANKTIQEQVQNIQIVKGSPEVIKKSICESIKPLIEKTQTAQELEKKASPLNNPNTSQVEKMQYAMDKMREQLKRAHEKAQNASVSEEDMQKIAAQSGLDQQTITKVADATKQLEREKKLLQENAKRMRDEILKMKENPDLKEEDLNQSVKQISQETGVSEDKVDEVMKRGLQASAHGVADESLEETVIKAAEVTADNAVAVMDSSGNIEAKAQELLRKEKELAHKHEKLAEREERVAKKESAPPPGPSAMEQKVIASHLKKKDDQISEMQKQIEQLQSQLEVSQKSQELLQKQKEAMGLREGESGSNEVESVPQFSEEDRKMMEEIKEGATLNSFQVENMKRVIEQSENATKRVAELQDMARQANQQLAISSVETAKMESENSSLKTQLEHVRKMLTEQIEKKSEEVEDWKKKFQEIKSEQINEQRSSGDGGVERLNARNKSLEAQLDIQKKKVESLTELVKKKENMAKNDSTKRELEKSKSEYTKLKTEHEALKRKNDLNARKATEVASKLQQVVDKGRSDVQKAISETESKFSKDKEQINLLAKKLKSSEEEVLNTNRKMKQLEHKMKQMASVVKNAPAQAAAKKEAALDPKTKRKLEMLETQNKKFGTDLSKLNTDLTNAKADNRKLQTEVTTMKNENDRLKAKLKVLQGNEEKKKSA